MYPLHGNWKEGLAIDLHTLSSIPNPDGTYNTTRTPIGEALFQLKYRDDRCQIDFLVNQLFQVLNTPFVLDTVNVIIPTPASKHRFFQPVYEIAYKVGELINIPVDSDFIIKIKDTEQLKNLQDINERKKVIEGAFSVKDKEKYRNKNILIIDDLFRSGTTLNEVSKTLYKQANVNDVYILTLTKTRSNR